MSTLQNQQKRYILVFPPDVVKLLSWYRFVSGYGEFSLDWFPVVFVLDSSPANQAFYSSRVEKLASVLFGKDKTLVHPYFDGSKSCWASMHNTK